MMFTLRATLPALRVHHAPVCQLREPPARPADPGTTTILIEPIPNQTARAARASAGTSRDLLAQRLAMLFRQV